MKVLLKTTVLWWLCAAAVSAQGIVGVEIDGNKATASIELPGGVAADLELTFEQAVGLSAASLGLDAGLIDPLDPALLSRMPGLQTSIPAAFPVRVQIEPPATGPLSFGGVVSVEIHTHNLVYTAYSPLRLFAATLGGNFRDITAGAGMGSYRVRGTKGGFSEFLIVADLRPADGVIRGKFARAQAVLDDNSSEIDGAAFAEVEGLLDTALASYDAGDLRGAISGVEAFSEAVRGYSGCGIPNVWRSSRDLVNVAGQLRASAATLLFSLRLEASRVS